MVAQLVYVDQALKTRIHVAVEAVVFKAYYAVLDLLRVLFDLLGCAGGLLGWIFVIIDVHLFYMVVILVNNDALWGVLGVFSCHARDLSLPATLSWPYNTVAILLGGDWLARGILSILNL